MALEGSIEEFGLPEIFQMIVLQKKEGILMLTHEKTSLSIEFKQGEIIAAGNGDNDARLADLLIKAEKIGAEKLKTVLKEQKKTKRPFIQILSEVGKIAPDDLKKLNRTLMEESVFELFEWKTGSYKFEPEKTAFDAKFVAPLGTEFVLMEGVRRIDEWPMLKRKISSREMVFEKIETAPVEAAPVDTVEEKNEDSFESMGELSSSSEEESEGAWLLPWIDGKRTVQQVIDHSQAGAFPVYKGLCDLLAEGKVTLKEAPQKGQTRKGKSLSFKELSRQQQAIRIFSNTIAGAALIAASIFFSRSVYLSVSSALRPLAEIYALRTGLERDTLFFAVDLYYLKHHRYPDSLQQLVAENFLKSDRERKIDLTKWNYTPNGSSFTLIHR
ncbi:MAG: DUF4388 domain-containing protein [Nitrospirae bacterium]|nr:DUF4388 domain-containing protein [Candidatus Manganitrophaceae bacterium]